MGPDQIMGHLFFVILWALFDQIGTLWQVQARELDLLSPMGLFGEGMNCARSGFRVFNPLFILLFVPIFSKFIYPMLEQVTLLTPLKKMGIGLGSWLLPCLG